MMQDKEYYFDEIESILHLNKDAETYDLEVDHPSHTFYANDISVSNSHSCCYAIISYQCAWLLTHFEEEWVTAYMEARFSGLGDGDDKKGSNDIKKAEAIQEIKSLGYSVGNVDINKSLNSWTYEGKTLIPALSSIKGIGEKAVEEIFANRPYKKPEDLLWPQDGRSKHSKFNKRGMDALIRLRAFDSMDIVGKDRLFKSYKHMHNAIMENWKEWKLKRGKTNFLEYIEEAKSDEVFSKKEVLDASYDLLGYVDMSMILDEELLLNLRKAGVQPLDDYLGPQIYWFFIEDADIRTTKKGKEYLLLNCRSLSEKLYRIYLWDADIDDPKEFIKEVKFRIAFASLKESNFGGGNSYNGSFNTLNLLN